MSLRYFGISHFPVLHRQFSSPSSPIIPDSSRSQDLTQDNKDVLIERLHDLVTRLSKDSFLEDSTVSAIHTGMDGIEMLMRDSEKNERKTSPQVSSVSKAPTENTEDVFWGPPTPTRNARMRFPDSPTSPRISLPHRPQMSAQKAIQLAKEAEELSSRLSATVAELQIRKEESDHIHDLLITRAEKAVERILVLESRVKEMEEDFDMNQSELMFLRIQLQAIQAQCAQCIPGDEDQELTQSIMNWKIDWEDIDRRTKARKKKSFPPNTVRDGSLTAVDEP